MTSILSCVRALFLVIPAIAAPVCDAQQVDSLPAGVTLRLAHANGDTLEGQLVRLSRDSITLRATGLSRTVGRRQLVSIQRREDRADLNFLAGAVFGGVGTWAVFAFTPTDPQRPIKPNPAPFIAAGAIVSGLIQIARPIVHTWVDVP